jgi:7-cyano-7-deazaguanine synthase in queuosine biosynthesis
MTPQTKEALEIIESAEFLADKIVALGDYAKEASLRLTQLATMQREAINQEASKQEPVARRHLMDDGWEYYDHPTGEDCEDCEKLYTRPTEFKTLTDDEVDDFMFQSCDAENGYSITGSNFSTSITIS